MRRPLLLLATLALIAAPTTALADDFTRPSDAEVIVAAMAGMKELVEERILKGASVDSADYRGRTALMLAARHNHYETVELLLKLKADIERVDYDGYTAAMWAARRGHVTTLNLILSHLQGTPAFDRQARLVLGVVQRVGDRMTERALRDRFPEVLGPMPPEPTAKSPWGQPATSEAEGDPGGFTVIRMQPPPRIESTGYDPGRPVAAPTMVPPVPGWPVAPATAPKDGPLSDLPPIPTPPPELALPEPPKVP